MITEDQLRWAEMLALHRLHGDQTALWIAQRALALAIDGDADGVERLRQIAERFEQMLHAERSEPN